MFGNLGTEGMAAEDGHGLVTVPYRWGSDALSVIDSHREAMPAGALVASPSFVPRLILTKALPNVPG